MAKRPKRKAPALATTASEEVGLLVLHHLTRTGMATVARDGGALRVQWAINAPEQIGELVKRMARTTEFAYLLEEYRRACPPEDPEA